MEVILLEKVDNLGDLGSLAKVRAGYARNYLIPYGKAKYATAENIAEFEARRAELEKAAAEQLALAQERAEQLNDLEITLTAKAGTEGKLFGSVGAQDIANAAEMGGVNIQRREVRLPNGPIREAGEYEIVIALHTDVQAKLSVVVEAEEE